MALKRCLLYSLVVIVSFMATETRDIFYRCIDVAILTLPRKTQRTVSKNCSLSLNYWLKKFNWFLFRSSWYEAQKGTYCQTKWSVPLKIALVNWLFEYSWFSPVMWWKLKIVTIQWIKSRILATIDDWYINNLAKNQVSVVFHSRVICRSVSPKFIELCMETPCLCPSEKHKYGGRKATEKSVTEFC